MSVIRVWNLKPESENQEVTEFSDIGAHARSDDELKSKNKTAGVAATSSGKKQRPF